MDLARQDRATRAEMVRFGRLPNNRLVMRALAMLLRSQRPSIYDYPPDEAAIVLLLEERARRVRPGPRRRA